MKRSLLGVLLCLTPGLGSGPPAVAHQSAEPQDARDGLHAAVDSAIDAIWNAFDAPAALGHVKFISRYWRLPGNSGYNASIDHVRDRLIAAGFISGNATATPTAPKVEVEEYKNTGRAWEHTVGKHGNRAVRFARRGGAVAGA